MAEDAARDAPAEEPWLVPGVREIGLASLLSALGHEVPTSLLPSFLSSTLGAPAAALGLIDGSRTAPQASRGSPAGRSRTTRIDAGRRRSAATRRRRSPRR